MSEKLNTKFDNFSWLMSLFGTAVGAGILFLPIQVGQGSAWTLLLVTLLIYPTTYIGHKLYALIPIKAKEPIDYLSAIGFWLPDWTSNLLKFLFISLLFTILIAYSISLTNDLAGIFINLNWFKIDTLTRGIVSFFALFILMLLVRFARPILVRILGGFSFLLMILLVIVMLALIPYWNLDTTRDAFIFPPFYQLVKQFLLLFPILSLSFMFFLTLSELVKDIRKKIPDYNLQKQKLHWLIRSTTLLLMLFTLTFVLSFMFSIPQDKFINASHENISALDLLGQVYKDTWLGKMGPILSIIAVFTSFIAVFIAYYESLKSLIMSYQKVTSTKNTSKQYDTLLYILTFSILWGLVLANISIMTIFGDFVAPLSSLFLFIIPATIVLFMSNSFLSHRKTAWFSLFIGLIIILAYFIATELI